MMPRMLPDGGPDQALEADQAQPPFEQDHGEPDQNTQGRIPFCGTAERLNEVAGNRNNKNE